MTISIPDDLREQMRRHEEVNWGAVVRKAIQRHLRKLKIAEAIAKRSELTEDDIEELDRLVKEGLAEEYDLA